MDKEEIKRKQRALKMAGYDVDINGVWTPQQDMWYDKISTHDKYYPGTLLGQATRLYDRWFGSGDTYYEEPTYVTGDRGTISTYNPTVGQKVRSVITSDELNSNPITATILPVTATAGALAYAPSAISRIITNPVSKIVQSLGTSGGGSGAGSAYLMTDGSLALSQPATVSATVPWLSAESLINAIPGALLAYHYLSDETPTEETAEESSATPETAQTETPAEGSTVETGGSTQPAPPQRPKRKKTPKNKPQAPEEQKWDWGIKVPDFVKKHPYLSLIGTTGAVVGGVNAYNWLTETDLDKKEKAVINTVDSLKRESQIQQAIKEINALRAQQTDQSIEDGQTSQPVIVIDTHASDSAFNETLKSLGL